MVFRFSTLIFSLFLLLLGIILFQIKYTVADLENLHLFLKRSIDEKSEEVHVLNAEWAYLNNPERLQELNQKYLNLVPIKGEQIISYADLQNSGLGEYDRKELSNVLQKTKNKGK